MSTRKYCLLILIVNIILFSCKKDEIFLKRVMPEVAIEGARLTTDTIIMVKDTVYILTTNVVRNANQVLSIEAGTLIKVKNNIGIIINDNGKIIATGSKESPIIFTSNSSKGSPGGTNSWNGISITGSADNSSGSVSYARIEFAGALNTGALSLNNVDRTTLLNNIQVSYSSTGPSVELAGGNCDLENIVSYASESTDFLLSNGYTGRLQNILSYRHPIFIGNANMIAGLLIQGSATFPSISNFTIIGPDLQPGTSSKYSDTAGNFSGAKVAALLITNEAKFHIRNSVLSGFPKTGFYIDSKESGISLQDGESDFTYSLLHCNDSSRVCYIPTGLVPGIPPITSTDFKNFLLLPDYHNQLILNSADYKFTDPYNYDNNPNPLPGSGSILLTGANFDDPVFSGPDFFKKVTYRGAFGSENWMQGWVNFTPLQTDYNN